MNLYNNHECLINDYACVPSCCRQCTRNDFVLLYLIEHAHTKYTETESCGICFRAPAKRPQISRHMSQQCYSVRDTSSVSSILKAIFPMLSPTRLKSRITPALDRADVLVARGRSPSTSRKSTKLGSLCRSGWAATRFMNLCNNIYFCHTDRSS